MIPFSVRVPVDSRVVLPAGGLLVSVDPVTDFDRRGKFDDDQARDKDTGLRLWVATAVDLEEPGPEMKFRPPAEVKARIASERRPVVPEATVPGYPPLIAFEGLTMTPYVDTSRCTGRNDKCRARLAYSLRAEGIVAFTALDHAA